MFDAIKNLAARLQREIRALYFAGRDPRTPRHAKIVIALVVAWALSPIDLIPDFIPVLGYLDDLIVLPLGIWLVIRLTPPEIFQAARAQAAASEARLPRSWRAAAAVILLWLGCALSIGALVLAKLPMAEPDGARLAY